MPFWSKPKRSDQLVVRNDTAGPFEVMVEVYPDRYVLQPGDRMVIKAATEGAPFDLAFYDGGVQIYPGNDCDPPVIINGSAAQPDWDSPGPSGSLPDS
jgi:hypothetical protein